MATFLEKNKKKSSLAALLLFLRTRKTVTALLLLVALASFLFVSPSNLLISLPGGARVAAGVAWIAGKVGVDTSKWGLAGGRRDYGDLLAAFRAAKDGGGKAGWSAFMSGKGGAAGGGAGSGSLSLVKGSAKDLEATGGSGANLPKPGSVSGVLNPDDDKARGEGDGVALLDEDVSGKGEGLVKSAFAGGFGSGGPNGGGGPGAGGSGSGGGMLSGGAFASSGFFSGGKGAVSGKLGDIVKGGLGGINPQAGAGVPIKGGKDGKLSAARASAIQARTSRGLVGSHTISGQRAFVQLAAGRGRAAISVAPNCTPGSGCPGEFAATNTGAVYDGNSISGDKTDILTAPELATIDGISTPNLPDTGMADDYIKDAEKMDADAKLCRELDDKYGPIELAGDQAQERLSRQFDAMGCGQGGCSKSKAKACQRMGDQMKAMCRQNMTVRCKHTRECPLTAKNNCSPDYCDGPARQKKKINDVNDGIRTTTKDMGEEENGCSVNRDKIPGARQATQNAVSEYRSNDCVNLRAIKLAGNLSVLDQMAANLKYQSRCAGRENQVVGSCNNLQYQLCKSERTCANGDCPRTNAECVITDLSGIEELANEK